MPPDLLHPLRAADAHLSAIAPGAHLEARIRARLRGQMPSSRGPFGGRRLGRPLMLAFAAIASVLFLVAGRPRHAGNHDTIASSPSAAPSAIPERIGADGGPPDLLEGPRRERPPRAIHAPALDDGPVRRDRAPIPARPVAAPPSSREDTRPPDPLIPDPGSSGPALPPPDKIADAHLAPVLAGPPPATTSAAHPHQSLLHDAPTRASAPSSSPSSPSSSPAPPAPYADDPNAGCRSAEELAAEAAATCKQKGLGVDKITYLDPCDDGRFRGASATCLEGSNPNTRPSGCASGEIGDGVTCHDYVSFPLKEQLIDTCAKAGLQLQAISITTDGCPDGLWSKASYQCCPAPPPPPPSDCSEGKIGDGVTCQDYATLKQQSTELCQKFGGALVDLQSSSSGCSDGQWSFATYKCCGKSPQVDPCTYSKVGDGLTCQDESALAQEAADTCAASGLSATATKLAYDCPGGQSTWGEIMCCPGP